MAFSLAETATSETAALALGQRVRMPGLDGLRAIAAMWVTAFHFAPSFQEHAPWLQGFLEHGPLGVELFFVISGFLITDILLRDQAATGTIQLRTFYFRRAFRILPPAFFYLLVLFLLTFIFQIEMSSLDFASYALFFRNWTSGAAIAGHYWSLSIEEQFYIIWPALMLIFSGQKSRLILTCTLLLAGPIFRKLDFHSDPCGWHTHIHCDGLLTGCLLAQLVRLKQMDRVRSSVLMRSDFTFLALAILIGLCATATLDSPKPILWMAKYCCWGFIALLVLYVIGARKGVVSMVLNSRPLCAIGLASYSLYLWQQIFANRPGMPEIISIFPLNFVLAISCTVFSYNCIEKPSLRLRNYLSKRSLASSKVTEHTRREELAV